MDVEAHPFDLRECVESALDLVGPRAAEKRLDVAYLFDAEVPAAVNGDVTRLRQVLLNLLANAVKFTERGEVVLNVGARPADGGVELTFAVRDTGIGLSEQGRSRLFRSFSQADSSTTRKYGGTGLGLAISKRLAELMGGTMWVESAGPGHGSTFFFTIVAPLAESPKATRRELLGPQPALAGRRVLVVDDNATNRKVLALQSAKWGMLMRDTESPEQALALAGRGRGVRRGHPRHAHARDGRRRARRPGARAAAHAAAGAVQQPRPQGGRRRRGPLRRLPEQAAAPVAAVRHAGRPVRARIARRTGDAAGEARARPRHGRAPSAAHPAGRGQRREPEAGAAPAAADGLPRRPGVATASRRSNASSASPTTWC